MVVWSLLTELALNVDSGWAILGRRQSYRGLHQLLKTFSQRDKTSDIEAIIKLNEIDQIRIKMVILTRFHFLSKTSFARRISFSNF